MDRDWEATVERFRRDRERALARSHAIDRWVTWGGVAVATIIMLVFFAVMLAGCGSTREGFTCVHHALPGPTAC